MIYEMFPLESGLKPNKSAPKENTERLSGANVVSHSGCMLNTKSTASGLTARSPVCPSYPPELAEGIKGGKGSTLLLYLDNRVTEFAPRQTVLDSLQH